MWFFIWDAKIMAMATRTALYNKPSYYKNVKESVEQQLISEGEDAESVQNSLIELDKRYHQIWRDASAPKLNDLLNRVYTLTFDILRSTCSPPPEYITSCGKEIDDEDFTDSLQRFNTFPILSRAEIEPTISVETTHSLRKAALLLIEFATKLDEARKEYYGITRESLTEEHNLQFSRALKILELDGYVLQISQSLSWTTSAANEFSVIATELDAFATQVNFQMHLLKTDQQMLSSSEEELLPCTHERVVWQFNDALFNWAKSLKPDELKELISNIINKYYAPSFEQLSTRHRKDPVINFLQSSMSERGDNRLAYILSAGNKDDGSLNRLLIEHLAPIMLQTCPIPSLNRDKDIFTRPESILFFTKATVHFAKTDERFSHLYSLKGQELAKKTEIGQFFCAAVFAWLDTLDRTVFYALIEGALLIYESGLSAFSGLKLWSGGGGSRRKEVEQYYKQYNQSGIVAAIFANGLSTSTLNEFLFKEIMKKMDQDLASNTEKRKLPMFQFINQFNALPYGSFYNELKEFAVGQTHKEVARKVASSSYSWF